MSSFGDAGAVERLARDLERAAGEVGDIGRRCVSSLEGADFEGPAASRLRDNAYGRLGSLRQRGEELRSVARVLYRHAEWIREQERKARRHHH